MIVIAALPMDSMPLIHTVLLGVISILLTIALPWCMVIERRLSRIEQIMHSELERVIHVVDVISERLRNLELEHFRNHPSHIHSGAAAGGPSACLSAREKRNG